MSLAELVAYEREREPLIRNTERFLAGLPAHHALLYGLPGTGKSSTVKAIMNEYANQGLRLVEVKKEDLAELQEVLEILGGRGRRFVLFVDDLSFEEHEVEYKALKALLEGSVEEPPENVRLYATSNRRNLIRETFSERERLRRRRRSRPRHHAGEALPCGPLRAAPDLPLSRPGTLPGDRSRTRQRTRSGHPCRRPAGTRPPVGPLARRTFGPHRPSVRGRARSRTTELVSTLQPAAFACQHFSPAAAPPCQPGPAHAKADRLKC